MTPPRLSQRIEMSVVGRFIYLLNHCDDDKETEIVKWCMEHVVSAIQEAKDNK